MSKKKILKIIGLILLIFIMIILAAGGYLYYEYSAKYPVNEEEYSHKIGCINKEKALFTENFELCEDKYLLGYYSSSAPKIYRGSKLAFRQKILKQYKNNDYPDSGYLNLRFYINCKGNVGNVEVNELDVDMQITDLTNDLVNQLTILSIQEDNWQINTEDYDTIHNHYMYLIYKIENGEIKEILP